MGVCICVCIVVLMRIIYVRVRVRVYVRAFVCLASVPIRLLLHLYHSAV